METQFLMIDVTWESLWKITDLYIDSCFQHQYEFFSEIGIEVNKNHIMNLTNQDNNKLAPAPHFQYVFARGQIFQ